MTDVPFAPGVTDRSYQPARLWLLSGGTWTVPSVLRSRRVTGASTLIAGITIVIGVDVDSGAATLAGLGAKGTLVPTVDGMSWAAAGGSFDPALSACATTKAPAATMTRPTMRIVLRWMPWGLWLGSVCPLRYSPVDIRRP